MSKGAAEIKYIQLANMDNLLTLIINSMRPPPLHYMAIKKKHIYFIPASIGLGQSVVYFAISDQKMDKKYIIYDTINDRIEYSDKISNKPTARSFPIIEIKDQNILSVALKKLWTSKP